jgi:hypothetical protein
MQMNARMASNPGVNARLLEGPIIIHDQVQVQLGRGLSVDLLEKANKLLMPLLRHAVPDDRTIEGTMNREQRSGAVTPVIVRHGAAVAGAQGITRSGPVEGLNLALLIHKQHQRLIGRVQLKTDDIVELFYEPRVAVHLERRDAMRPEAVLVPNVPRGRFADTSCFGHQSRAPVGRGARLPMQRSFHERRTLAVANGWDTARTESVVLETRGAQREKPLTPQLPGGPREAQVTGDLLALDLIGGQHYDVRPLYDMLGLAAGSGPSLQGDVLLIGKANRFGSSAHMRHQTGKTDDK